MPSLVRSAKGRAGGGGRGVGRGTVYAVALLVISETSCCLVGYEKCRSYILSRMHMSQHKSL